jgi:hypothetical protein
MAYTGNSVVDYLKSVGQSSDFTTRANLAKQFGITNYTGTANQNTRLLTALRSGQAQQPAQQQQTQQAQPQQATQATAKLDPFAVAAKYGYSAQDFANDPNFYNYWSQQSESALQRALMNRADFDKNAGRKVGATQQNQQESAGSMETGASGGTTRSAVENPQVDKNAAREAELQQAYREIDAMSQYNREQKAILKNIAYTDFRSGQDIYDPATITKIIEDAARNAETDLTPHYNKITSREIEDIKKNLGQIRDEAARYREREEVTYSQKLADTKKSLRMRGLTFSGIAKRALGNEAAAKNTSGYEGDVLRDRRLAYEQKTADWQDLANRYGTEAERNLGSSTIQGIDFGRLSTPYGDHNVYNAKGNVGIGEFDLSKKYNIEKKTWESVTPYKLYTD